ncbi:hypothetical protein MMC19_005451 [Ptychographa xylographoides]|nr:hypothetical protein [Ptychographa xylographoides]
MDDVLDDELDRSIQYCPSSAETRLRIIEGLGGRWLPPQGPYEPQRFDAYFRYYSEQCRLAIQDSGPDTILLTHWDIIQSARIIRTEPSKPRNQQACRNGIKRSLRARLPVAEVDDEQLNNAINFVLRLLLMVDIGRLQYGISGAQLQPGVWNRGDLKAFVSETFPPLHSFGSQPRVKLEKVFNGLNLKRFAGIQIIWTDNLADHLRMRDDDTRIAVFHHATFLEYQRNNRMFPDGFVEETLRTLALLLPQYDVPTKNWFRKVQSEFLLDKQAAMCGDLRTEERQIERFLFWQDRLVIVKQVFDEAEPGTLSQWWYDRRKGVQWYTFWVAVLVLILAVFFGVIQCIEGGLQAYKAFYPK